MNATPTPPAQVAVLASGTGSLLEAMLPTEVPIGLVLVDRPCRAYELATAAGRPALLIDRRDFGYQPRATWDRAGFTAAVVRALQEHHIHLVAMAGFMTIFAPNLFEHFSGRVLNTHPSLLPDFKGERAVADALAAGVTMTGCTIHIATPELDSGRILAQRQVPVQPGDTVETLWERIKVVERQLYPETIQAYLAEITPQATSVNERC